MVREAVEWRWSSHRAVLGKEQPPPFLDIRWTLVQFARRRELARQAYADFIAAGEPRPQPTGPDHPGPAQARLEDRGQAPGQVPRGRGRYD